jgi:hypothetical protein
LCQASIRAEIQAALVHPQVAASGLGLVLFRPRLDQIKYPIHAIKISVQGLIHRDFVDQLMARAVAPKSYAVAIGVEMHKVVSDRDRGLDHS